MRPELANVFYYTAMKFGGGKGGQQSMASQTDFQGQKMKLEDAMELAMQENDAENADSDGTPKSAYERLMSMAEENPSATVDELMKIVNGASNG